MREDKKEKKAEEKVKQRVEEEEQDEKDAEVEEREREEEEEEDAEELAITGVAQAFPVDLPAPAAKASSMQGAGICRPAGLGFYSLWT